MAGTLTRAAAVAATATVAWLAGGATPTPAQDSPSASARVPCIGVDHEYYDRCDGVQVDAIDDDASAAGDAVDNAAGQCKERDAPVGAERRGEEVEALMMCAARGAGTTFYLSRTYLQPGQAAAGNMNHKFEHWIVARECRTGNYCYFRNYLTRSNGSLIESRQYTGQMTTHEHDVYVGASFGRTAGRPLCQFDASPKPAATDRPAMLNASCYYRYG